ncbi:hypothetical protein [Arsenicicoccus dermatophilus]|uniref:hypothetical protein n=1 Tax=Arsenicicoccus dermatophilus TaxID=1076331 RepID=UPI0039175DB1
MTEYVDLPTAIERISDLLHEACHDLARTVRNEDRNTTAALTVRVSVLRAALEALTNRRTEVTGDRPMNTAVGEANIAAVEFSDHWASDDATDTVDAVVATLTKETKP